MEKTGEKQEEFPLKQEEFLLVLGGATNLNDNSKSICFLGPIF